CHFRGDLATSEQITQPPLEKAIHLLVCFFGWRMPFTTGHGDTMAVAQEFVDGDGVVQRRPALGQVSRAAGNEKRSWRHQGVQFQQVDDALDERFVSAGAWQDYMRELANRTDIHRIRTDCLY